MKKIQGRSDYAVDIKKNHLQNKISTPPLAPVTTDTGKLNGKFSEL